MPQVAPGLHAAQQYSTPVAAAAASQQQPQSLRYTYPTAAAAYAHHYQAQPAAPRVWPTHVAGYGLTPELPSPQYSDYGHLAYSVDPYQQLDQNDWILRELGHPAEKIKVSSRTTN